MEQPDAFLSRRYRLCYLQVEKRLLDSDKMALETHLSKLGAMNVVEIDALDDPRMSPCDLVVVAASHVPVEAFPRWVQAFQERMKRQGHIWTPALIMADVPFDTLRSILLEAVRSNWYFDILSPAHIASAPIRVANMLRIHDHLHELKRYAAELTALNEKVGRLERDLATLGTEGKDQA